MPVTVEKIKMLFELEERNGKLKLGTYLYNIGKRVIKDANPTKDIRELREDRYAFRSGQ